MSSWKIENWMQNHLLSDNKYKDYQFTLPIKINKEWQITLGLCSVLEILNGHFIIRIGDNKYEI